MELREGLSHRVRVRIEAVLEKLCGVLVKGDLVSPVRRRREHLEIAPEQEGRDGQGESGDSQGPGRSGPYPVWLPDGDDGPQPP